MAMRNNILIIFTVFNVISIVYSSDSEKEFHFGKEEGSEEYNFKYKLDNGEIYSGKTHHFYEKIYIMFGVNDTIYGVEIDKEENNENEFTKIAHLADRMGNKITWKSDLSNNELDLATGYFSVIPYQTNWDLDNICFSPTKNEDQTFTYTILSLNNSRKYNGTTNNETDDPMIQRIHLNDGDQRTGVYEIHFTEEELNSDQTFCRGISKRISEFGVLGAVTTDNINQNLLKSLAG